MGSGIVFDPRAESSVKWGCGLCEGVDPLGRTRSKGILYILPATISFQCQRSLCTCLAFGRQQQFRHLASFSFCFDGNRGVDARNGGCAAAGTSSKEAG